MPAPNRREALGAAAAVVSTGFHNADAPARKPDLMHRIDWLDDIERRRGRDARAELEVEIVLALPDKPSRHQHLAGVALRLGDAYRLQVEAGVHATWRTRKAAAAGSAGKGAAC